jgi:hypothetical protein
LNIIMIKGQIFLKYVFITCCSGLFLTVSCSKDNPKVIQEPIIPEPVVYHQCPNDADVYKLVFDTLFINSKREMYTVDSVEIKYKLDNAMPLGVCEKTSTLYGSAQYSPLSAMVKNDENVSRSMKWDRYGYFRDIILSEDMDRILTFPDGKKITFELSLLNHSNEVIQTSPIVLIYKEKFPEK